MHLSKESPVLAGIFFAIFARALPRPASYSVVNVDGGTTSFVSSPPTIVQTTTESQQAPSKQGSTVSVTVTDIPATTNEVIIPGELPGVTGTKSSSTQGTKTTPISEAKPSTTGILPSGSTVLSQTTQSALSASVISSAGESGRTTSATTFTSAVPTSSAQEFTVTIISTAKPSTSYYDNGQWHTSYGKVVYPTQAAGYNGTMEAARAIPIVTSAAPLLYRRGAFTTGTGYTYGNTTSIQPTGSGVSSGLHSRPSISGTAFKPTGTGTRPTNSAAAPFSPIIGISPVRSSRAADPTIVNIWGERIG